MLAQLQLGEIEGLVVMAVYEMRQSEGTHTPGLDRRWIKVYPTRADACWDVERLSLLSPATASALKELPPGTEIPALSAYVRDPKETLRTFTIFPITQAQ